MAETQWLWPCPGAAARREPLRRLGRVGAEPVHLPRQAASRPGEHCLATGLGSAGSKNAQERRGPCCVALAHAPRK